jgi:hypothetical protein
LAAGREDHPLFFDFESELKEITSSPERALKDLIARDPVKYQKTKFRAFLGYSKKECDRMTMQDFLDACVILEDVIKVWHAPYLDHNQ